MNGEGGSTERRDFCTMSASGTCPCLQSFCENVVCDNKHPQTNNSTHETVSGKWITNRASIHFKVERRRQRYHNPFNTHCWKGFTQQGKIFWIFISFSKPWCILTMLRPSWLISNVYYQLWWFLAMVCSLLVWKKDDFLLLQLFFHLRNDKRWFLAKLSIYIQTTNWMIFCNCPFTYRLTNDNLLQLSVHSQT